jgi:hypothetical protein
MKMKQFLVLINPDTPPAILQRLKERYGGDFDFLYVATGGAGKGPLFSHPDMVAAVCGQDVFCRPDLDEKIIKALSSFGVRCEKGMNRPEPGYPRDCLYNCVMSKEGVLIHRLDMTDQSIRDYAERKKMELIDVKQGYTRCSVIPVSGSRFITEDEGIAAALEQKGKDVCLVRKGFIRLKGFPYGFIGGAGAVFRDDILFFGDIAAHPDHLKMRSFAESSGKNIVSLGKEAAEDLGGMFIFENKTTHLTGSSLSGLQDL